MSARSEPLAVIAAPRPAVQQDQGRLAALPVQATVEALQAQQEGKRRLQDRPDAEHQVVPGQHEVVVQQEQRLRCDRADIAFLDRGVGVGGVEQGGVVIDLGEHPEHPLVGDGRGAGKVEFDGFRLDMGDSRELFVEYGEALLKGGKSGPAVVPGKAAERVGPMPAAF